MEEKNPTKQQKGEQDEFYLSSDRKIETIRNNWRSSQAGYQSACPVYDRLCHDEHLITFFAADGLPIV